MIQLHEISCDGCHKAVGKSIEEIREIKSAFMSQQLSVSGIPMEVICEDCLRLKKY